MVEPQNNIRIFIDGHPVFSEEIHKKSKTYHKDLDDHLRDAKLTNVDCLFSLLTGVLCSPTMKMPDLLKRVQAWAAGETSHVAYELLRCLKERFGEGESDRCPHTEEVLTNLDNFELAVEGIEDWPCDEKGMGLATSAMDEVLVKAQKTWDSKVEKETIKWLCRFLLGRTCHDVSLLFNFVYIDPERITDALSEKLRALRFKPLDFFGLNGGLTWTGIWFRTSVVDTDAKSADKIPDYASQLDEYAKAYYNRFHVKQKEAKKGQRRPRGSWWPCRFNSFRRR
jgi:hypothetical protein